MFFLMFFLECQVVDSYHHVRNYICVPQLTERIVATSIL